MSPANLMTIHSIQVLEPTYTIGAAGSIKRSYAIVTRTIKGRVVPQTPAEGVKLQRRRYQISHTIYFRADPQLGLGTRLQLPNFGNVILRVVPPFNPSMQGRFWVANCTYHQEDNQAVKEGV